MNRVLGTSLVVAAPFSAGTGQIYAGDWKRGVAVGLGVPLIYVATGLAMAAASTQPNPPVLGQGTVIVGGGLATAMAYMVWAAYDAAQTADRKNQEELDHRQQ